MQISMAAGRTAGAAGACTMTQRRRPAVFIDAPAIDGENRNATAGAARSLLQNRDEKRRCPIWTPRGSEAL